MKRHMSFFSAVLATILSMAALSTTALAKSGGDSGGSSKTAFGPGEHVIQLPPMWIPVNKHKKHKGKVHYAPVTIFLTSKDGGITNMCYQLPYLEQAFLFKLNTLDIRMTKQREIQVEGLGGKLLSAAIKATDKHTVKSIKVVSYTPHPTTENQNMLKLCR